MYKNRLVTIGVAAVAMAGVSACGGGGDPASDGSCPKNLVIQTNWWPEVEHGGSYQLIGPDGTTNPKTFAYSGKIDPKYAVGGIETVEVRSGGDAIDNLAVTSVMQSDQDIYLGYVDTDDAIATANKVPVTGVAATLEISPMMLMWDPSQLDIDKSAPDSFKTSGARVAHFAGATYIDWMVDKGYLDIAQSDPTYGGSPDAWISAGGNFVQQGFATNEIGNYETAIPWKNGAPADVEFALVHDLGWQPYPTAYSILTSRLEAETDCLTALVPKLQQAWVDFLAAPDEVGDAIIGIADTYDNYWTITDAINQGAYRQFAESGIGGNGPDEIYGNFDTARVESIFDELAPILAARKIALPSGYTAESVYTNEFIDESIGIG